MSGHLTWLGRGLVGTVVVLVLSGLATEPSAAAELLAGGATISITPDRPVALDGQFHTRIARQVESPVTATALALESRQGQQSLDQAIMVSCDLVAIRHGVLDEVRAKLKDRLPDFDTGKLFLSATHTHTAPVLDEGKYEIDGDDVMRPREYRGFLTERLAEIIVTAWQGRAPAKVGWGVAQAVVAHNRRAVYGDGRAQMYGAADRPDFRGLEGYEDHDVNVLYVWTTDDRLLATAIHVPCPAQEVEGRTAVNADFWHPVRQRLREKYGEQLLVLAWAGAAGDQSPHLMYRKAADERMRQLRGLDRLDEIARRIVAAWEEAYDGARRDQRTDAVLTHRMQHIALPKRQVTADEAAAAKQQVETLAADPKNRRRMLWHQEVVDRFERQSESDVYDMELHVVRLGDVAIATNDFELFTDYGVQIKARSPAVQTFVIQLAGPGTYLPSERAVRGGGYSAVVESGVVGPSGGQALVDQTVEAINSLWGPRN